MSPHLGTAITQCRDSLTQLSLLVGCLLTEESFSLKCPKHKVRSDPPYSPVVFCSALGTCLWTALGTPCSAVHPPQALSPIWHGVSHPWGMPGHPGAFQASGCQVWDPCKLGCGGLFLFPEL